MKRWQLWIRHVISLGLLCASLAATAGGGSAGSGAKATVASKDYDVYRSGNVADALPPQPAGNLLVLMGGGIDVAWTSRRPSSSMATSPQSWATTTARAAAPAGPIS